LEGLFDDQVWLRVNSPTNDPYKNDDPFMTVVECLHEKELDNYVDIVGSDDGTYTFLRDKNGTLWYVDDVWSRKELIDKME
jgi:hypothetical protein